MDNIAECIKNYMQENQISYDDAAKKIGWTRQNLWDKLNKRSEPNIENMVRIAESLGFKFCLYRFEEPGKEEDTKQLFEAVEMEQISYTVVEKILNSVGYSLKLTPPEK